MRHGGDGAQFLVASGAATFPGDYAERPAQRSDLKAGSFVSIECQPTREGCQTLKLTMVRTDQPK